MKRAISEYRIAGVQTTLDFADFVMNHETFVGGEFSTHFVEKYFSPNCIAKRGCGTRGGWSRCSGKPFARC